MESDGKGNDAAVKPKPTAAEETNTGNASSTVEEGKNSLKKAPASLPTEKKDDLRKNIETVGRSAASSETTSVSAAARKPPASTLGDSKKGPKDSQRTTQEQPQQSTQSSSSQQEQSQDLPKKRTRQQESSLETNLEQPQNLTKNKTNEGSSSDIWERYDLTATEMTTTHERAELQAVQKQVWKKKKFIAYTGVNSAQ